MTELEQLFHDISRRPSGAITSAHMDLLKLLDILIRKEAVASRASRQGADDVGA